MRAFNTRFLVLLLVLGGLSVACQLEYLLASSTPTAAPTRTAITSTVPQTSAPVSPNPTQPVIAEPTPEPQPVMGTATGNVRIRATPSTAGAVLGRLNQGETAKVVGRTAASDWLQIVLPTDPNGRGWVSAEFLMTDGDISQLPIVQAGTPSQPKAPSPAVPTPTSKPYP